MRNCYIILVVFFIAQISASAQKPWTDPNYRSSKYPSDEYFVSYYSLLDDRNEPNDCISKTILGAQNLLAQSIFSEVSSITKSTTATATQQGEYFEEESFYSEFQTASTARLVQIHIDHYYDPKTKTAYALAYVKKDDLYTFYKAQLDNNISVLNSHIENIEKLIEDGYKTEARETISNSYSILSNSFMYLSELLTVSANSGISPYTKELDTLSNKLKILKSYLEHGTSVFFEADTIQPATETDKSLINKCKGILSSKGCNFPEDIQHADFSIKIHCETITSSKTEYGYFAIAEVTIQITRMRDSLVIYNDMVSVKGGSVTEEKAHRKSIDSASNRICENLLKYIQ